MSTYHFFEPKKKSARGGLPTEQNRFFSATIVVRKSSVTHENRYRTVIGHLTSWVSTIYISIGVWWCFCHKYLGKRRAIH